MRDHVATVADPTLTAAWETLETFCAVGLRLIAQSNPSKVRDIAVSVSIQALMVPGVRK